MFSLTSLSFYNNFVLVFLSKNMCGGAIISDFIGVKRDRDLWFELDPSVDLLGLGGGAAAFNTPSSKELPPLSFEKFFSSDKKGTYILYQPLLSLSCSRLFLFPHHYTNVFIQFFCQQISS